MVNLGQINFQISVPLNIDVNERQSEFEVRISKKMAKIFNFQSKIGQDATFSPIFIRF